MANTNEIQGDVVGLFYSTDGGTTRKEVVCAENTGVDGTRDVNSKRTKCGVIKGFGPASYQINFSGAANSAPGTGKASMNDLMGLVANGTSVLWIIAHATDDSLYYRGGNGQISKFSETGNTGDVLSFDATVDISGDLTIVAPGP